MKFLIILTIFIAILDTFSLVTIFPMREKTKYTFRNKHGDRLVVYDTIIYGFNTKFITKEIK